MFRELFSKPVTAAAHPDPVLRPRGHGVLRRPSIQLAGLAVAAVAALAPVHAAPDGRSADVLVLEVSEAEWLARQQRLARSSGIANVTSQAAPKPNHRWFIPRFFVDNSFFRDETTLYSVRNEAAGRVGRPAALREPCM